MSGEPVALKAKNKIIRKLKFLYRKKRYFTKELRRMLYKALVQPHFDYACSAWYSNLNGKMKNEIQIIKNKCIRFCLKLDKMHHISEKEFRLINCFRTSKGVDQCINTIIYNFVNNTCPYYLNKIFEFVPYCRIGRRNNSSKLNNPFRKTNMGQKTIFLYWSLYVEQLA